MPEENVRIVEETYLPGISASLVGRPHKISGSQIFTWRRLLAQGALTAATAGEGGVPASGYRALEAASPGDRVRSAQSKLRLPVMKMHGLLL